MIIIVHDEQKKGLIAPCKCASKTIEIFAGLESNKWRKLPIDSISMFKVRNYQFGGIVRNPISWYISGYFHCLRNYRQDNYKPTDFLSHIKLVYDAQNNLETYAKSKYENMYWHAIIPPPVQMRYYGFNVTKVFKLDSSMFENNINNYLGATTLTHQNKTPIMEAPNIDLECKKVLKKISHWGYEYGYDIDRTIKKLKVNTI